MAINSKSVNLKNWKNSLWSNVFLKKKKEQKQPTKTAAQTCNRLDHTKVKLHVRFVLSLPVKKLSHS